MSAAVESTSSSLEKYFVKVGHYIDTFDEKADFLSHASAIVQHIPNVAKSASMLSAAGAEVATETHDKVSDVGGHVRSFFTSIRLIAILEQLFTGKMFWETRDNRWLHVAVDKHGKPIRAIDKKTGNIKKDSKGRVVYLSASECHKYEGAKPGYVQKDWMSIAISVFLLVARILSPLTWLNQLKAIDLGRHAKAMGGAIVGAYAAVCSLSLIKSIRDIIEGVTRKRIGNLFGDAVNFMALPFECGVGMGGNPIVALVGAILCSISAGWGVVKEFLYYG